MPTLEFIAIFVSVALVLVVLYIGIVYFFVNLVKPKKTAQSGVLNYLQGSYLRKIGGTTKYPNYDIISLDGGLVWHAVRETRDGHIKILGHVEEVYPGLLKQLVGLEALIDHVKNNGPIGTKGRIEWHEISQLQQAGFEIRIK